MAKPVAALKACRVDNELFLAKEVSTEAELRVDAVLAELQSAVTAELLKIGQEATALPFPAHIGRGARPAPPGPEGGA